MARRRTDDAEWHLGLLGARFWGPRGQPQPLTLRPALALVLGRVAVAGPAGVARAVLAEALWPEQEPGRAAHSLTQALGELRAQGRRLGHPFVEAARGRVVLASGIRLDVADARAAFDRGPAEAVLVAAEAVRGGLLDGIEPRSSEVALWLDGERAALIRRAQAALGELALAAEADADLVTSLRALDLLVALDPLDEDAHAERVRLLLAAGRSRDALRAADDAMARVEQEFGTPVGDRLRAARRQAQRAQTPQLALGPPRVVVLPFQADPSDPQLALAGTALSARLVDHLARAGGCAAIAPSAARGLAGREDALGIAQKRLDADYVVEGEVVASPEGGMLHLRVVHTATACVVWSTESALAERGGRPTLGDAALQLALAMGGRGGAIATDWLAAMARASSNLHGLSCYAQAREHYERMTVEGYRHALDLVRRALAHDPSYAPAWLLLAHVAEGLLVRYEEVTEVDLPVVRRRAILKAFELDPFDGRILVERGDLYFVDGDRAAANHCYAAAAADPAPETQMIVAKYLAGALDDRDAALAALRRAEALHEPGDLWLASNRLRTLTILGEDDTALQTLPRCADSPLHLLCATVANARLGERRRARELERHLRARMGYAQPVDALGQPYLAPYLQVLRLRDRFHQGLVQPRGPT